jgi:outer membrane protein assembly factor BamB
MRRYQIYPMGEAGSACNGLSIGMASTLLFLLGLLALSACAGSTASGSTAAPSPSSSSTSSLQTAGALYLVATSQSANGSQSSDIYALGLTDGKQLWHVQVAGTDTAALGGATLYVGAVQVGSSGPTGSSIEALNATTGVQLWQRQESTGIVEPIGASADAVFAEVITFASSGGAPSTAVEALRASDGTPVWTAAQLGASISNATVGDGVLYVITGSAGSATAPPTFTLVALDINKGKSLWHRALQGAPSGPSGLVLSNGVLYLAEQIVSNSGQTVGTVSPILAVRASDGVVLWQNASPTASTVESLVASGGTVCYSYGQVTGQAGGLVALRATDGHLSWQAATQAPGAVTQAPGAVTLAADPSTIYALESTTTKSPTSASVQTTLLAFDATSGAARPPHLFPNLPVQADFGTATQPYVAGGVLYVVGMSVPTAAGGPGPATPTTVQVSVVLALRVQDGSLLWDHEVNGSAGPVFLLRAS